MSTNGTTEKKEYDYIICTPLDWNLVTTPQKHLDNRVLALNRGRFLGGSSGFNGTLCIRGRKEDWDAWGLEGWSGDEMFDYMKESETFHSKPWFPHSSADHGSSGPLYTEPHDLAPISALLLQSMQEKGLPLVDDLFTTGGDHGNGNGCGHVIRTVFEGKRTFSTAYLELEGVRGKIDILTDMVVDKIVLDGETGGELVAKGVVIVAKDGTRKVVNARREVIISAGAYCSPAILLRSGIGPKAELDKLGITCLVDSPGVGKNLHDHVVVFVPYEVGKEGLTNDVLLYHGNAASKSMTEYQEQKTGLFSTFPFGAFAFARLDDRLKDIPLWKNAERKPGCDPMGLTASQPNIEFMNTELYSGHPHDVKVPMEGKHGFELMTILFSAQSTGTVTLQSTDPFANPTIDPNYLADPLEMLVLSEGVRFGNEIVMQGRGTKDVVRGSWPDDLKHHTFTAREDWEPHVRAFAATAYHPAGTCKMGRAGDATAVLDEKMRVRCVRGLRVVDVSVMPALNGGHTHMPAYAIGEKGAALILQGL